jgi:hypothetical protein
MGTRLYPRTDNPAVLEKLAQVPAGTMQRLRSMEAQKITTRKGVDYYLVPGVPTLMPVREFNDMQDVWEAEWNAKSADEDVSRMDWFLSEGWGKMHNVPDETLAEFGMLDENGYLTPVGDLGNEEQIATLLIHIGDHRIGGFLSWDYSELVFPHRNLIMGPQTRVPLADLGGVYWC